MKQKYLFVGEFDYSYTGGSIVFISTEEFLQEFEIEELKVILDPFENQLRRIRQFPIGMSNNNYDGITIENFWERVSNENFTDDFVEFLKKGVSEYKSYFKDIGNIRVDHAFPDNENGIYIVYKLPVESENDEVEIISNTYYCA